MYNRNQKDEYTIKDGKHFSGPFKPPEILEKENITSSRERNPQCQLSSRQGYRAPMPPGPKATARRRDRFGRTEVL
jgi:hypothetical protein